MIYFKFSRESSKENVFASFPYFMTCTQKSSDIIALLNTRIVSRDSRRESGRSTISGFRIARKPGTERVKYLEESGTWMV